MKSIDVFRWALLAPLALVAFAQAQEIEDDAIEEVVVVGTQIRGAAITDALPVSVLDADDLEAIGVNSGDELLEHLPEQGNNFFSEAENISGGVNSVRGDVGAFNLRNVGTGNTLVLLNGRRLVNTASYQTELVGGSFVPVNTANSQSLPVTALRRVEVLKDGASAIYGADAVAGVVNYVLKDDFEGLRVRARYDDYDNLPRNDIRLTIDWGQHFNGGRTRVGVFGNYYDRDRVNSQDDARWADSDFRKRLPDDSPWKTDTRFRNDSANSRFGQFDILSSVKDLSIEDRIVDGAGEFETYPTGDARCEYSIADGICGAKDRQGTYRYNLNENRDLAAELDRINIYGYLNHDFGNGLESFTDFSYYYADSNTIRAPSHRLSAVTKHTVAADNPYNPFGPCGSQGRLPDDLIGDVPCSGFALELDNYRWTQVPRIVDTEANTFRLVTGLRGTIDAMGGAWDWEGAITWSRATRDDVTHNRISNTLLQQGLDDTTSAAINPFAGGEASNIARALVDVSRENETELRMIDFKLSNGELIDLPTGPVGAVFGLEYREESFEDDRDPRLDGTIAFTDRRGTTFPLVSDVVNSSPSPDSNGERDVLSAFVEFAIPVGDYLNFQLAVRYEDFSDVGSTTVGKAAFGLQPTDWLMLRGSWSEAFRAPNLVTINESIIARSNPRDDFACEHAYPDPRQRPSDVDCNYGMQRTAQGSEDLKPEESTNTNIGIVLTPLDGVTFTLDYWEIEKEDTIGLFGERNILAEELLALIAAGTANCDSITSGVPSVTRNSEEVQGDPAQYRARGICPVGEVQRVSDQYANLDDRNIKGHDVGLHIEFATGIGEFDLSIVGSFLGDYEQEPSDRARALLAAQADGRLSASAPVTGFTDLIRQNGNIDKKYSARVRWERGNWAAHLTGLHYGDFIQTSLRIPAGTLPDQGSDLDYVVDDMRMFNASVDYNFDIGDSIGSRVRFGVNNFTDERAPIADRFFGYFADQHSDFGRYFYLDWELRLAQ